jgi:LemA protein
MIVAIILVVIVGLAGYVVVTYNNLVGQIESINNAQKQIDVQLDRRFKVFESLINVLRKYMDYEKSTLSEVTKLRTKAQACAKEGDQEGKVVAEEGISNILGSLNVQFEAYPDLKANQNALQLQEEIVSTENKLTYSKQAYNDSIERYNANKKSMIASFIVGLFSQKLDQTFVYWGLSDEKRQKDEDYTVNL